MDGIAPALLHHRSATSSACSWVPENLIFKSHAVLCLHSFSTGTSILSKGGHEPDRDRPSFFALQ